MTLVVDASVVVKWLLNDPERELEMQRIAEGGEQVIQPTHWLFEGGAVLARISAGHAISLNRDGGFSA